MRNPAAELRRVERTGAQLWLTRRGRFGCAVIPFYQVKILDEVLGGTLDGKAEALEAEYARYDAAKRVQAAVERKALAAGLGVGGAERTALVRKRLARGEDPWTQEAVLLRP